jgi:hypothetical protein
MIRRWLPAALAVAATAACAPPADAHFLTTNGYYISCSRDNGVACITDVFRLWPSTHSHMHSIPSAINYICAGARNRDGSWKNASACFDWNNTHRADVYYQSITDCRFAGWWQGGGAANLIIVESDHVT